ncbi:MAG TPA: hypothetical protein VH415_16675 [Nitrososphaeraceae archaeon]
MTDETSADNGRNACRPLLSALSSLGGMVLKSLEARTITSAILFLDAY